MNIAGGACVYVTLWSMAKPQDSLTAPIRNHFVQLSLTILDIFLDAIDKAKN